MKYSLSIFLFLIVSFAHADDNYRLWLKYERLPSATANLYYKTLNSLFVAGSSPTLTAAQSELKLAISGFIGKQISSTSELSNAGIALIKLADLKKYNLTVAVPENPEGFIIIAKQLAGKRIILICSRTDIGILYGVFAFIKKVQLQEPISAINFADQPKIKRRILNHWDNLDRTVERGYAGFSLWNWQTLPNYIDQRYIDYARANASIGINGTVLTNVNANALILTRSWLIKVKALADAFRPYGLKVYLTARFSAPIEIGGLKTADPLASEVVDWWHGKAKEIYELIPDFGGFLVKANSEGQPGPQNYRRNHADGANMLAKVLQPYHGIVMWRAFVYDQNAPEDRAKQAFSEFKPLDGKFESNVIIQVKNGALDFQPREPFHPLFGALEKTNTMMELQLTQEYLGMSTHLAYLGTLFNEVLDADTYVKGKGTTVAQIIEGNVFPYEHTAIAGVANIGNDINWCGHPLAQSNWFAFGRLAWNPEQTALQVSREWINLSFQTDPESTQIIQDMMMMSREALVKYMTPLGLAHMMGWNHHYGPAPWIKDKPRVDWTSVYYHQADKNGIGFNRTPTGSNATAQYAPPIAAQYNSLTTCPEQYLLWFHHLPWDYRMKSGHTLWDELVTKYYQGTQDVASMRRRWDGLAGHIDAATFSQVKQLLAIQEEEAIWWRDACVLYFQSFANRPIPKNLFQPLHDLNYYQNLEFRYVPGIKDQN